MATVKTTKDSMASNIADYIKAGISAEARKIADTHKEEITKEIDNAMSDIVARVSTRLVRYYTIHDAKDHIEIHVRKEGLTNTN